MKILLVGEYSRLHNSLKEGLIQLGHEVTILGFKDGFKDFPVDFPIEKKWDAGFLKKIKLALLRLTGFDISSYLTYLQFNKNKKHFINHDVVQLINENSFFCHCYFEQKILAFLFKNNQKNFLLSCSEDYVYVNYNFANTTSKSIVQPYLEGKIADKDFSNVLKFKEKSFKKLHDFIYQNTNGVIASDIDYDIPLKGNAKYLGLIPNPINTDKLPYNSLTIHGKTVIFLGINKESYYKKGYDYFENALEIIQNKYAEKTEIIITRNIPYKEYINLYNSAHILLDQVYANDQGYNALEAMAKGKVVFTGAEQEFNNNYSIKERVCINALPNVDYLVNELSFLIENPNEIKAIGQRARTFVEKEHDYLKIARKYLDIWDKN